MTESGPAGFRRLPPGPHGLPPELVGRNQRERLIAAMAEVCAERGYGEATVADVAKHAGVSTASFYKQFQDKRACMLASFEELFGRLLEEVKRACEAEREEARRPRVAIGVVARLLGSDLPTARLLSTEIDAAGPDGVRLKHGAIDRLAGLLRQPSSVAAPDLPDAAWVAAAALLSLVAKRAAEGKGLTDAELEAIASQA